jgi:hypothetical protein
MVDLDYAPMIWFLLATTITTVIVIIVRIGTTSRTTIKASLITTVIVSFNSL